MLIFVYTPLEEDEEVIGVRLMNWLVVKATVGEAGTPA